MLFCKIVAILQGLVFTIVYNCRQYRPQKGGICVANHTSPIDVLILTTDGCYAMVRSTHRYLRSCMFCGLLKLFIYFGTH